MILGKAWSLWTSDTSESVSASTGEFESQCVTADVEIAFVDQDVIYTGSRSGWAASESLELDRDAKTLFEVNGCESGRGYQALSVPGVVAMGGTVDIRLVDGFEPEVGDHFWVISCGGCSGFIARFIGLYIGEGRYFHPVYTDHGLLLEVRMIDASPSILSALEELLESIEDAISIKAETAQTLEFDPETLNARVNEAIDKLFGRFLQLSPRLVEQRGGSEAGERAPHPFTRRFRSVRTSNDLFVNHHRYLWRVRRG